MVDSPASAPTPLSVQWPIFSESHQLQSVNAFSIQGNLNSQEFELAAGRIVLPIGGGPPPDDGTVPIDLAAHLVMSLPTVMGLVAQLQNEVAKMQAEIRKIAAQ